MPSIITPYMSLIEPTIGEQPGPNWAQNLNASLSIIDSHDHSSGKGIPVTPAGMSIISDLSFGGNNATDLRSLRFDPQGAPLALGTDLGCIYVAGDDLYYNDTSGNQIRFTQSGAIVGAPGTITGLVAPASAVYTPFNQTFTFESNTNVPANLDIGSITLREMTTSPFGITLQSPSALAADYVITMPPSLPSNQSTLVVDGSGIATFVAGGPVPTGSIIAFAGPVAPSGYLLCDGTVYLRATYLDLFNALGGVASPWGLPSGTQFTVPDLTRRYLLGPGGASSGGTAPGTTVGSTGGSELVQSHSHSFSATSSTIGDHNHALSDPTHYHSFPLYTPAGGANNLPAQTGGAAFTGNMNTTAVATGITVDPAGSHSHTVSGTSGTSGAGNAQNMPPSAVINYIIKT